MIKIKRKIQKLKWGIAGCGKYAEHTFIPALTLLRKSTLNSLYSQKINRAKQLADKSGASGFFNDYGQFLKSDINCVYVASINSDHYKQVIKAAEAGKHIFCEKPVALNSQQAQEMVDACTANNVLFSVNYLHRFHPHVIKAKSIVTNQTLGKLVSVSASFNIDLPPGDNFRFTKKLSGGGAFRDLGTHMIDMLRYFGGEIVEINGYIDDLVYKSEVDDFAVAIVKFKTSGYGYLNVSYNSKRAFNRIEILGHKGTIGIDNWLGGKNQSAKLSILLEGQRKMSFWKRGNKLLNLLKAVQKSFLKNEELPVTGEDGLINMKIMEELERKCQK
jgi:predicted dehydrogenase